MDSQQSDHKGLRDISRDSDTVASYYDEWAVDYDSTLAAWHYQAPDRVASMLRDALPAGAAILDAGCGTGLSGRALHSAGFLIVDGIDVSAHSLAVAEATGAYRSLREVDMQALPLPIEDNSYDGLACVGVLTYLPAGRETIEEFCRILRPGGVVVLTQRSDLFVEREFSTLLGELSDNGLIEPARVSKPEPYLPENQEFGDRVLVHYIRAVVAKAASI